MCEDVYSWKGRDDIIGFDMVYSERIVPAAIYCCDASRVQMAAQVYDLKKGRELNLCRLFLYLSLATTMIYQQVDFVKQNIIRWRWYTVFPAIKPFKARLQSSVKHSTVLPIF